MKNSFLRFRGEVGGGAIDHPVGAEAGHEVGVLAAAHRRHLSTEALDDLHGRRADGGTCPGRAEQAAPAFGMEVV